MSKKKRKPNTPKPASTATPATTPKTGSKPIAKPVTRKRTTLLTIALVIVILHGLLWTAISWAMARDQVNVPLYLALLVLTSIADVVAGFGMWKWKRWGIYLYVISTLVVAVLTLLFTGSTWIMLGGMLPTIIVLYILNPLQSQFD